MENNNIKIKDEVPLAEYDGPPEVIKIKDEVVSEEPERRRRTKPR
jgi:hypothetical protein